MSTLQPARRAHAAESWLGTLEGSDALPDAWIILASQQTCEALWLQAIGRFAWLELEGAADQPSQRIERPAEVLGLNGTLLLQEGRWQTQVFAAGRLLLRGKAIHCTFRLDAFRLDPVVEQPKMPDAWSQAATASVALGQPSAAAERPMQAGDWVQHPVFGLCRVDRLEGEKITVRLHSGIRKTLSLAHLHLGGCETSDGKRTFRLLAASVAQG